MAKAVSYQRADGGEHVSERPEHYRVQAKTRKALVEYVLNGGNQTKAAQVAGMSQTSLSRALRNPHIRAEMERIELAYNEQLRLKARRTMDDMMDAKSEHVRVMAATAAADRTGFGVPKGPQVSDHTLIVNIKLD